jgi:hypothetical protein
MTREPEKPVLVELEMREEDVEAVINEFQADNPGKAACDMSNKEFADRMMKKIMATMNVIEGGSA